MQPANTEKKTGRSLYVYNVHLDHRSQPSRLQSAKLLRTRIEKRAHRDPVLVTGDFNAGESNAAFEYLVTHDLEDTFRTVYPAASGVGTFNGFRGETDGEKIDAVLASPAWDVLDAAIVRVSQGGRYPSDHFPVTAVVRIPS